jgi:hypothetical protein
VVAANNSCGFGREKEVFVLWQEIIFTGGSHRGEAFFARSTDGARSFETPLNLSNSLPGDGKGRITAERWDNGSLDLATGPQGDLYATWTDYDGGLWFSRSIDRGVSFSAPTRGPDLAIGRDGMVFLAWTIGEEPAADIRLTMSTDRGRTFDTPRTAVDTDGHGDAPKIAVAEYASIHLVLTCPHERYHVLKLDLFPLEGRTDTAVAHM